MKLTLVEARARWWQAQFPTAATTTAIADTGWLRTLGGVDAYLAARARVPGLTRAALDGALAKGVLRVVPAARGCIYLVPRAMVADLMALNAPTWRAQAEKDLAKAKRTLTDVTELAPAVLATLAAGPLGTDAIRKAIPGIPSFGEAGKKAGISSPLPLALRHLELEGAIERMPETGRLDTERYLWRVAKTKLAPSKDPLARLVAAFLAFAGPATLAQIAAWSGRSQRDLKAALGDAVPVTVEGLGEAWLARETPQPDPPKGLALLAFEDNYLVNHGLGAVTDPKHHAIRADIWGNGGKPEALGEAEHMLSRTIVIDGLVAGFWEIDPRVDAGVWHAFSPPSKALAKRLDAAVDAAHAFLRDELGHARAYTLDTMEHVQARADAISKA
jgi:DNA glycosylase AlkZ-like